MSQRSSDVPMLANFSIYIFPWDLLWTGLYRLKYIFSIDSNANQKSETLNKSQLSEFFDVPSPWLVVEYVDTIEVVLFYGLQIVDWLKSIEERLSHTLYPINLRARGVRVIKITQIITESSVYERVYKTFVNKRSS